MDIHQLTIRELLKLCQKQVWAGNGDKYIIISDDVEGNGYHGLYFGFRPYDEENYKDFVFDSNHNSKEDTIVLG